jgi:hypothetical protein
MPRERRIVIVSARCSGDGECFGIRLESRSAGTWSATWAFAIKAERAKREGYGSTVVKGAFDLPEEYPGCPHCHAKSLFVCSCGQVACWSGSGSAVMCPACHKRGNVEGTATQVRAGGDH